MAEAEKIGEVIHYFDKIGVAIIKLDKPIKKGESVEIRNKKGETQNLSVDSMQIDHQDILEAKAGDEIGVKVQEPVHEDNEVYRA